MPNKMREPMATSPQFEFNPQPATAPLGRSSEIEEALPRRWLHFRFS
jgi:hypothetical protein